MLSVAFRGAWPGLDASTAGPSVLAMTLNMAATYSVGEPAFTESRTRNAPPVSADTVEKTWTAVVRFANCGPGFTPTR
jgi:hypothetical protein